MDCLVWYIADHVVWNVNIAILTNNDTNTVALIIYHERVYDLYRAVKQSKRDASHTEIDGKKDQNDRISENKKFGPHNTFL